jgi:crooked neck
LRITAQVETIKVSQWSDHFIFQGTSIGKCPKNKLFKGYIELELQLYEKFLEFGPENCTSWIKFAELETILGDIERARAIYELAISQPRLDMPEVRFSS